MLDKVTKLKYDSQINNGCFRASSQPAITLKVPSPTPWRYYMVGCSSIVSLLHLFPKVTVSFTATTSVVLRGKFGSFLSGTLGERRYQMEIIVGLPL